MPWDNKNNGPWNGGNNPWGKKDNSNSNNNWNPKNRGDDLTTKEIQKIWLAMYTYNSVEGVYFNDNPSGYLGAY